MLIAIYVHSSFQDTINDISGSIDYDIVLAFAFIISIVLMLFTEGLPVMYSLRGNVLQSMNFKPSTFEYK